MTEVKIVEVNDELKKQIIESLTIDDIPQKLKEEILKNQIDRFTETIKLIGKATLDLSTSRNELITSIEQVLKTARKDTIIMNSTSLGESTQKVLKEHNLLS